MVTRGLADAVVVHRLRGVVIEDVDRAGDLAAGFGQRFALLAAEGVGQFLGALVHAFCGLAQQRLVGGSRFVCPLVLCGRGGFDRAFGVLGA